MVSRKLQKIIRKSIPENNSFLDYFLANPGSTPGEPNPGTNPGTPNHIFLMVKSTLGSFFPNICTPLGQPRDHPGSEIPYFLPEQIILIFYFYFLELVFFPVFIENASLWSSAQLNTKA